MTTSVNHSLRVLLTVTCTFYLTACTASQPIEGVVLEHGTEKPVPNAIVVARWDKTYSGLVHSTTVCTHVEAAIADERGYFHVLGYRGKTPMIDASAPGYEQFWPGGEINNERLYLKPFIGTHGERFEYLVRFFRSSCHGASRDRSLISILGLLYSEANQMALTEIDREERLRYLYRLSKTIEAFRLSRRESATITPLLDEIVREARTLPVTNYDRYLLARMEQVIGKTKRTGEPKLQASPLIAAMSEGDGHTTKTVLAKMHSDSQFHNLNDRTWDDKTALMVAGLRGDHEVVDSLLAAGADPNRHTFSGESALGFALQRWCQDRNEEKTAAKYRGTVEAMLRSGKLRVNEPVIYGETALSYSVGCNLFEIVSRLLHLGADVNIPREAGTPYETRVLGTALEKHRLSQGRNAADADNAKKTLLLILNHRNVDLDAIVIERNTPLTYAITHGDAELVRLLLARGADPNAAAWGYTTPLGSAVSMLTQHHGDEQSRRILDVLLQSRTIDVDKSYVSQQEVIEYARVFGPPDIVKLLEDRKKKYRGSVRPRPKKVLGNDVRALGNAVRLLQDMSQSQYGWLNNFIDGTESARSFV